MDNLLSDFEIYLKSIKIPIKLACNTKSGWPIIVSLWFLYENGNLYCATQKTAKIVSLLDKDPKCGYEISDDAMPYCGIRGRAIANIEKDLGKPILRRLLERYLGDLENPLANKLIARIETEVAIVLEPVSVYHWDFSTRMKDIPTHNAQGKICP